MTPLNYYTQENSDIIRLVYDTRAFVWENSASWERGEQFPTLLCRPAPSASSAAPGFGAILGRNAFGLRSRVASTASCRTAAFSILLQQLEQLQLLQWSPEAKHSQYLCAKREKSGQRCTMIARAFMISCVQFQTSRIATVTVLFLPHHRPGTARTALTNGS